MNISTPSRYAQIVLPLAKGAYHYQRGVSRWHLRNPATGTTVLAQVERGARHADGSAATVLLLGDFGSERPASVDVIEDDPQRVPDFVWHPDVLKAREMFSADHTRLTWNGHVARQYRLVDQGPDRIVSMRILTVFTGCAAVRIDWMFLNGHVNAKQLAVTNFAQGWYPSGWLASYTIEEHTLSGAALYFPQRGRRVLRGVLHPEGVDPEPARHGAGCGLADGPFGVFSMPIPTFGVTRPQQAAKQSGQLATIRTAIHNGTPYPYPAYTVSKRLGIWHPCLGTEGGETGGSPATPVSWISQAAGIELAYSPTQDGILLAMHEQRMILDRCATALHDDHARPLTLEDYDADKSWSMRSDDARFDVSQGRVLDGPFGFSTQPPLPPGTCPEQPALDAFEPIDFGHYIREIRAHIALAWVCNDTLSRELLIQAAELARMSLFRRIGGLAGWPGGVGTGWQRIQGWQARAIAEAYCFGGNPLRQRYQAGWQCQAILDYTARAMMPNGCLQVDTVGKEHNRVPYNSQHGVTLAIHQGLLCGGLSALARAMGLGWPVDLLAGVEFLRLGQGTLWSAASRPKSGGAPYPQRQPGPLDSSHPQYQPSGQAAYDSEQTRALVGLAGFAGDPRALDAAKSLLGPTPAAKLRQMGANAEDSDAILLAFLESVGAP